MHSADVSCSLIEFDFSGIEAVLTGFYLYRHGFSSQGARQYIRLSRLDIHSAVTAVAIGQPVDLTQPDDALRAQLKAIKKSHEGPRDICKRVVHGSNFGMSTFGLVEKFPQYFPTLRAAEKQMAAYYALAPDLPHWHQALRKQARDSGFLGGIAKPGTQPSIWAHPYGYQHWFWDVLNYKPCNEFTAGKWLKDPKRAHRIVYLHGRPFTVSNGGDANRVIAFYPQSTAAGRLKEAELRLFLPWSDDFIGDVYFGRTPLLAPIHDSLLLHVPNRCVDRVVEIVARVMQEPSSHLPIPADWGWGDHLPIGVAAKIGKNWAPHIDVKKQMEIAARTGIVVPLNDSGMDDLEIPQWVANAGADAPVMLREGEGLEEDFEMLQRSVA